MAVKDYFSAQAADYARYRPRYPAELFAWVAAQCPNRGLAWDCACGSGQATVELARYFDWVVATDASRAQLAQAPPLPNVEYRCATAEASGLARHSFDLVLVAQALHWFDLERFYAEVRRVVRPGGLCVAITYNLFRIDPEVDAVIDTFYQEVLGQYWPPERRCIENGYRTLAFPFDELVAPQFTLAGAWSLGHLCGYLNTWSALEVLRRETGRDPLPEVTTQLERVWGDAATRPVNWPVTLKVGRVGELTV